MRFSPLGTKTLQWGRDAPSGLLREDLIRQLFPSIGAFETFQ
jgi:hypothetical protein